MCGAKGDVRFNPESGHVRRTSSCLLWANSGHSAVSKVSAKSELSSRKLMLLDGALKRFRRTFDPVVKAVISLNWQHSNDLALPRTGTAERPLKIDNLTDGVF